jgi:uncharacterized membrane protein
MEQNRFKSWAAWLTLLPVITILGDTYGLWNVINMPQNVFTKLFVAIGVVGTAFGIFNNPTKGDGF